MALKKNNPGCNCCNPVCSVTCNKRLYFGVTGVTANSSCIASTGGSSIIAIGDAITPSFFNSNTWYWDPAWVTGTTPGLEDIADGYSITACNTLTRVAAMTWFYIHDGVIGSDSFQVSTSVSASVSIVGGVSMRVVLVFGTTRTLATPPFTVLQSRVIDTYDYPGLCPEGTPTLSRSINNAYCLDFNPSTTFMTWV